MLLAPITKTRNLSLVSVAWYQQIPGRRYLSLECSFSEGNDTSQARVCRTYIVLKVFQIQTLSLDLDIRDHTVKTFCWFVPGIGKANGCFSERLHSSLFHSDSNPLVFLDMPYMHLHSFIFLKCHFSVTQTYGCFSPSLCKQGLCDIGSQTHSNTLWNLVVWSQLIFAHLLVC